MKKLFNITVAGEIIPVISTKTVEPFGCYEIDERRILVHPSVLENKEVLFQTVRHEIVHAAMHISGIAYLMDENQQEAIVRMMDGILWRALDDLDQKIEKFSSQSRPQPEKCNNG